MIGQIKSVFLNNFLTIPDLFVTNMKMISQEILNLA